MDINFLARNIARGFQAHRTGVPPLALEACKPKPMTKAKLYGNSKRTIAIDGVTYNVPSNVTLVDSIKFDGATYLILLVGYKNTYTYKLGVKRVGTTTTFLFGQNPTSTADNIGMYTSATGYYFQNGASTRAALAVNTTDFHDIIIESDGYTVDGLKHTVTAVSEFEIQQYLYLGAAMDSTGSEPDSRMSNDYVSYAVVLDENGDLLCACHPAIVGGVVGLYDFANGGFIAPEEGTLTAGNSLPTPDMPLGVVGVGDKTENLFDKDSAVLGTIVTSTGEISTVTYRLTSDFISVSEGDILNGTGTANKVDETTRTSVGGWIKAYYDSNKAFISDSRSETSMPLTIPSGVSYVRIEMYFNTVFRTDTIDKDNAEITIVKSSTAPSSYIPFGYKFPLLHAQNCGMVDLGTLNWTKISPSSSSYVNGFKATLSPNAKSVNRGTRYTDFYCSAEYTGGYCYGSSYAANKTIFLDGGSGQYLVIGDADFDDATAFKSAMSGVYLYYQRTTDTSWTAPTTYTAYLDSPLGMLYKGGAVEDMSKLSWSYSSTLKYFYASLNDLYAVSTGSMSALYCPLYSTIVATIHDRWVLVADGSIGQRNAIVCIKDLSCDSTDALKAKLKGVPLYYQPTDQTSWSAPVFDTFDFVSGEENRGIVELEFDGSSDEAWTEFKLGTTVYGYRIGISATDETVPAECNSRNEYVADVYDIISEDNNNKFSISTGRVIIGAYGMYSSVNDFMDYIATNPIRVKAKLATRTTTQKTAIPITAGSGDNYLDCETEVKASMVETEYRSRTV